MEEDIGFLSTDGNVGRRALGDGVWGSRDILCLFVFREALVRIGLD